MKKNASEASQTNDLRNSYIDERTEERIQEHLTNENDIITEEDIANAPTGVVEGKELPGTIDSESTIESESSPSDDDELEDEKLLEEKKVKSNDEPNIETSWNVLGS